MQRQLSETPPLIDCLYSYILIMLPFLYQYKGLGNTISFGEMLILPFMAIFLIYDSGTKILRYNISLFILYFWTILSMLICGFLPYASMSESFTMVSRLVFYAFVILVSRNHFHYNYIKRTYEILVLLFAIYAIAQYVFHMVDGGYLPMYIKYEWLFPPEMRGADLIQYYSKNSTYRVSSLFLEPGYFVLFSFPAIVEMVVNDTKKYVSALIIAIAIIMSGSAAGFVGIFIILLYSYFSVGEKKTSVKIGFVLATAIAVIAIFMSGLASYSISRVYSGGSFGGSFEDRIVNGLIIYKQLPFAHKLIGAGINNTANAMDYYGINTGINMWGISKDYCASVFSILNGAGIIGLLLLIVLIFGYWRTATCYKSKCLITILAFILCYEAILYTYRFAFYIVIIESLVEFRSDYWRETAMNS